jgi:hypothetical protein
MVASGAALSGMAAILLKAGAVSWDVSVFRVPNEVPPAVTSVFTPLSQLFLPAGIVVVVVVTIGYVVAGTGASCRWRPRQWPPAPHRRWRTRISRTSCRSTANTGPPGTMMPG